MELEDGDGLHVLLFRLFVVFRTERAVGPLVLPERLQAVSQKESYVEVSPSVHACYDNAQGDCRSQDCMVPRACRRSPAKLRAASSVTRLPPRDRVSTEELMRRDLASSATPLSPIELLRRAGGKLEISTHRSWGECMVFWSSCSFLRGLQA